MKALCQFVLRFAVLFGLLAWPWPGFRLAVGACFRAEARFLVGAAFPRQACQVGTPSYPKAPSLDATVIVPDLDKVGPDGRMTALAIPFDSNSQGWIPLALLIALATATPLPWFQRLRLVTVGIVLTQMLIAATILVSVSFNLSSRVSPADGPLLLALANRLLVENIWIGFVPSFLLWAGWLAWGGEWKRLEGKLAGNCS